MFSGQKRGRNRKNDLLNVISLSNRKGRLINFGTWAFVFMVDALQVCKRVATEGRGRNTDSRERNGSLAG